MRKKLKRNLSIARISMLLSVLGVVISLFYSVILVVLFCIAFNFARLKAREYESRIKFLKFLDNFPL